MTSLTNRNFKNPNYKMPNDISTREKTQDDLDREKKTQEIISDYQSRFDLLTKNSKLQPPEYPIKIAVKENKFESDFIEDNTGSLIYASSFEDAISKVKNNLSNQDSTIQQSYNDSGLNPNNKKLRLSSQNKGMFRSFVEDLETPYTFKLAFINKSIKYWIIILSDAPPSTLSNYRISNQKIYNKGGKSKKTRNSKKSRKSKKSQRNYKKYRRRSYKI